MQISGLSVATTFHTNVKIAVTPLSVVTQVCTVMLQGVVTVIVVAPLSVYIADTLMLLPSLSQCYLGHCCHSTVKYNRCHNTVTTTDVTLVAIVTAVTLVWTAVWEKALCLGNQVQHQLIITLKDYCKYSFYCMGKLL